MSSSTAAAVRVIGWWASPFVIRVFVVLKLKGVEYEFLQEVVGNKSELLLKSNPVYKKVPVLLHHGKPICESLIIVEYVDEVWSSHGPPILPADPYARAIHRFWAAYIDDRFSPAIRVLKGKIEGDKDEAVHQMATALQYLEEAFLKCSQGRPYFNGDNISYVDIVLGSYIGWIRAVEKIASVNFLDETKVPNLVAWVDRFCVDPVVGDAIPDTDKFVEFNLMVNALFKDNAPK